MRAFLKLYHDLFVYNPVAMILTTAVMLWICAPVYLYIIVKFIALIKFFKGKITETHRLHGISILLQEANGQYVETLEAYQKLQCEIKDLHSDKGKEETGTQLETLTHILQNFQEKDCIRAWCSTLADGIVISFHRLAAEGCKPTAANWDDLKVYTYSTYPNFAAWHIRHFADIEKKEAQICLLVKLGFIPSEMAILLVTSRQNIANIRKCLLKRYFEKDGIPADFDREIQTL